MNVSPVCTVTNDIWINLKLLIYHPISCFKFLDFILLFSNTRMCYTERKPDKSIR